MPERERIQATTLAEADLAQLIELLDNRFKRLSDRVRERRQHFFCDPAVDPVLGPPYDKAFKFQSDVLRDTNKDFVDRVTENHFVIRVKPSPDTAKVRENAQKLETIMNEGLRQLEKRQQFKIQRALATGQSAWAYGVLHWSKADDVYPAVPDYEWLEELPEEEAERSRYKRKRRDDGSYGYRETDDSVQARHRHAKAVAGYPWMVECLSPDSVRFVPDRSLANGMGFVIAKREIGFLDYSVALRGEQIRASLNQVDKAIRVYGEQDAPQDWMPSRDEWGTTVTVAQVWTRDEVYELAQAEGGRHWTLIKSGKHPYGMPPFVIVPARVYDDIGDPALKYEPYMEGLYRIKPLYDRQMTLMHVISEMIALPIFYLVHRESGMRYPDPSDPDKPLLLTRKSLSAMQLPPGYEIARLDYDLDPAFLQSLAMIREDMAEAKPSTGQAEITSSTQPWTIRLQQAQANLEPASAIGEQQQAILVMAQNQAMVMSLPVEEGGFGEAICVYAKVKDGKKERQTEVSIEPKDIPGLMIEVDINPTSEAEQATKIQIGLSLLQNPLAKLDPLSFWEEWVGDPDPQARLDRYDEWFMAETYIKPGLMRQQIAKRLGEEALQVGVDGEIFGPNGQAVPPETVLASRGIQQAMVPEPTMGAMPSIQAPGTMPMQGMPV